MKTNPIAVAILAALTLMGSAGAFAQDAPTNPLAEQIASDPQAALAAATRARDAAVADWPTTEVDALADAVENHAIAAMLAPMPGSARTLLSEVWASHPRFIGALARVYTDKNDGATIATMAQAIAAENAEALEEYPDLAAAVCVVLDRPRTYPGLGAILPGGADVFDALVFAHQDRRVIVLPLDEVPAEILVYLTDTALTGKGIRTMYQDRRRTDPYELYKAVPYKQAGLLAGEAAPPPEEFTFDRIAERGGLGPLRSFYAEQLGQAFGFPVALATGHLGDERFLAPVYLMGAQRRVLTWNPLAIPDHPGLDFGTTTHPVTGEPMPLPELMVTGNLASRGTDATRKAWALIEAAELAEPSAKLPMLERAQQLTMGFADSWGALLDLQLESAAADPDGAKRVLAEFFEKADAYSSLLATRVALDAIESMDNSDEMLEWLSLTSRRDPHRYAAARLAIGDAALASGDREAAKQAYEDVINRHADDTPLALDAFARLETMISQDGQDAEVFELYARTHRRFRAPRTSDEAVARASAFMVIGERYERLLLDAGRDREAERLRRRLDQALP